MNFPFISFQNSIPPGPPVPDPTIPPPSQPELPPEEPPYPDRRSPVLACHLSLRPALLNQEFPSPRAARSHHPQTDIGFSAAFICSGSAPVRVPLHAQSAFEHVTWKFICINSSFVRTSGEVTSSVSCFAQRLHLKVNSYVCMKIRPSIRRCAVRRSFSAR